MAQVTAPVILDSTGQQIVSALQAMSSNIKPTADEIKRTNSNNQTVEAALVALNNQFTLQVNDTITSGVDWVSLIGICKSSSKVFEFSVPSPKKVPSGASLSVTTCQGYIIRGYEGGALSGNTNYLTASGVTVTATRNSENYILLKIEYETAQSVTNISVVMLNAAFSIKRTA